MADQEIMMNSVAHQRHVADNEKRLQSLKKWNKDAATKRDVVQKALTSLDDGIKMNKKITFDSDDDDEKVPEIRSKHKRKGMDGESFSKMAAKNNDTMEENYELKAKNTLFESSADEDENENTFHIRPEFEGKAGKRLMQLQHKFQDDKRFRLDKRFRESASEDENEEEEMAVTDDETVKASRIADKVLKKQDLVRKSKLEKKFRDVSALRFDPAKLERQKLVVEPSLKPVKTKAMNKESKESTMPEVDTKRYYHLQPSLCGVFALGKEMPTNSFSLLSQFGKNESVIEADEEENDMTTLPNPAESRRKAWFMDRVSDTIEHKHKDQNEERLVAKSKYNFSKKNAVQIPEVAKTFFFLENDLRLKEGIETFVRKDDLKTLLDKWQQRKPFIKMMFKTKYKSMKRKLEFQQKLQRQKFTMNK